MEELEKRVANLETVCKGLFSSLLASQVQNTAAHIRVRILEQYVKDNLGTNASAEIALLKAEQAESIKQKLEESCKVDLPTYAKEIDEMMIDYTAYLKKRFPNQF